MNSIILIDTPSQMDRENGNQKNASESEITMMENSFSAEEQVVQALKTDVGRQILSSQAEKHFELEVTDARYGSIIIQLSPKGGNSLQKLKQSCATGNIKDFLPNIFMGSGVENTLGEGDFRWKVSIYVTPYRHGGSSNKVDAIKIHWKLLVEEMNPWTLLADLQAKGLLGKDEEVEILKLDSRKDRMKFLLKRLLASKEPDLIFEVLLEHCQEHNEYVYQRILKIEGGLPDFYEHEELSAMADKTSETERESQSDQGMIYSTILILKIRRKQSLPTAIHPGSDSEFEICHLDILEPVCYFDFEAELHKEEEDADDLQNEVVMVLEQVKDPLTDQASVGKAEAHKEEGDAADLQNEIAMVLKQVQEPLTDQASVGKGFALGSTVESKTKGIWACCRPHPVKKDKVLQLLDTEGLGDTQKGDRNNDNQILALALLLSSTVDYIILLKFSNDGLERLSFVTKIDENIQFSDKMSIEESGSNLDRVFPTFILTLRDFPLDLIYQGKQITSDEYLELVCLSLQPDTSPKIHNNNMGRLCLREYFKIRKCFTFERPGGKTVLSCLDDLEDQDLDKDFVKDSQLFTDYVLNKCHPKQMNNGPLVNGRQFVILVESYVESIQKGKVPNVEGALNNLINLENTRAIEKSVRIYQSGMNAVQYPTADSSALFASHVVCHNEALDFFRRHSMSDAEGNYYYIVNSQIKQEYEKFRTRDQEESAKKSQKALEGLDSVVKQNINDGRYHGKDGYKLYLKDMKNLETKYDSLSGLGCKKSDMLDIYLRETASRGQIIMLADEALTKKEKEIEGKPPRKRKKSMRSQGSNVPKGENKMAHYESLKVFQMPLCLIETGSDGKLKICQDVLTQIKTIEHALNIVCIVGPYRTGKSYLLTRLAGCSKGFALGNTIESKTKGIWVWCRPHPVKKDQVLLLMDTEGLGDIQEGDRNNDSQILALGLLLSSTIVYNMLSKSSNDDLETLSFVTKIAEKIQFSDKMSIEESGSNLDRVFPTFILTLRDFTLNLVYQGKQITSDEYLELVYLSLQPDTSPKIHNNNMARLCLREYFKIRKCFTFESPGGKTVLSCFDDLEDKDLVKKFVKDTQLFTDYVHNECHPKQMNTGRPVNGRQFAILAESYVESIQRGKVPNVEGALKNLINLENTRAIDKSVRIYQSGMNALQYPTPNSSALFASHVVCHNEALDFFRRHSMSDVEGNYYYIVNSQIKQEYEKFRTRDQEESAKKSQEALEGLDSVVKQNLNDGRYHGKDGYKLYLKDMKNLQTKYDSLSGLGCKKSDMLDIYLRETASRGQKIMLADEALTKKEKEIEGKLHQQVLTHCLPQLVRDLDVTSVCMYIPKEEVLDEVTVRDILEQTTTSDKTKELIKQIQQRDQDTYEKFKECLVQSKQKSLKDMLEEEEAKLAKEIKEKQHLKRKRSPHSDDTSSVSS